MVNIEWLYVVSSYAECDEDVCASAVAAVHILRNHPANRYGVSRANAEALFDKCDDDKNGVIDLQEFLNHYDDLLQGPYA